MLLFNYTPTATALFWFSSLRTAGEKVILSNAGSEFFSRCNLSVSTAIEAKVRSSTGLSSLMLSVTVRQWSESIRIMFFSSNESKVFILLLQHYLSCLRHLFLVLSHMVAKILFPAFAVPQFDMVSNTDKCYVVFQGGAFAELFVD